MAIYKISCFNNKNCLNINDHVRVIGKKGLFGEVKADQIIRKDQPVCQCIDPDFGIKLFTEKFDKEGEVTYIKAGEKEFHFLMQTKE